MKMPASMAAGLCLGVLPALAQAGGGKLAPPVNVVLPQQAPQSATPPEEDDSAEPRQSIVIEEDGTVRFLTPQEAADVFIPPDASSRFSVDLRQSETGPDSLSIEVTGAEISDSLSEDGRIRVLRIVPDDGGPTQLITITKD